MQQVGEMLSCLLRTSRRDSRWATRICERNTNSQRQSKQDRGVVPKISPTTHHINLQIQIRSIKCKLMTKSMPQPLP
jgi:hypothetical protein